MKSRLKRYSPLVLPVAFIVFYFLLSGMIFSFGFDSIVSSILTNIIVSVLGCFYVRRFFVNDCRPVNAGMVVFSIVFLFFIWLFSQITVTWILNHIRDVQFEQYQSIVEGNPIGYLFLALIFAPIAEEILYRGMLFNSLCRVFSSGVAYFVSAFVFAIMHGTIVHMVIGFVCGIMLALVYHYTGKLWMSIVVHMIYNSLSLFATSIIVPDLFFDPYVFITVDMLLILVLIFGCWRVRSMEQHFVDNAGDMSCDRVS